MLAEASAWVKFVAFYARVRALLERQVARLPDVSLTWLPVTGLTRATVQIRIGSRLPLLLLIAGVCVTLFRLDLPSACEWDWSHSTNPTTS